MNSNRSAIYDILLIIAIIIIGFILVGISLQKQTQNILFPPTPPPPTPPPPISPSPPPPPPPPPKKRYKCIRGKCHEHHKGDYLSLSDCKYECGTGKKCKRRAHVGLARQ